MNQRELVMRLAFSTLGCPAWDIEAVVAAARRFGYGGVELRALAGTIDLPSVPELSPPRRSETRRRFEDAGIAIVAIDSSCAFHDPDVTRRRENVALAARHAELAADLGAPLVRVFPNEVPEGESRDATRERIAESLRELAERLPAGVRVGLETHGDFATATDTAAIVARAAEDALGIVWDAANTVAAGEDVEASAAAAAPYLAHVHLRDAAPSPGRVAWRPALAGRGHVPLARIVAALRRVGYAGWISFEWEKHWLPDLEDPEVALPDFAAAVRPLLG